MSTSSASHDYGRFDELAEEFAERYRQGERPSLQEYVDRLPEMAKEIREMFPAMVEVEQADGDARGDMVPPFPVAPHLSQIGDYRIVREIGRGGMGVVYEAEQMSLGRRVAVKVLPGHVTGDRKSLERFRREAKSTARLHHTNIVPVFEVGREYDVSFYAMQLIQGQGLDQVIDELRRLRNPGRQSDGYDPVIPEGPVATATVTQARVAVSEGLRKRELSRMAESLLIGRLVTEGPGSLVTNLPAATGLAATEGFDPDATSRPESAAIQDDRPQGLDSSGSAVLPGGKHVSEVDTSGRRQPFFRSVAQIGRQAAQGLAHAHARGIVHRDIKPSNLLLDTAGVVWITDFGLAKVEDDGLTASGDILGTLRYMAPERFRGEGDARADIYALGLTLYELLTLQPAYHSSDRMELIEQIKAEEPARPRSLDSHIPRDLETIVLKAIDKDPDRRYPTAEAMAEDLGRFLADEPVRARQISTTERYWRWAWRNPVIAVLGGVLTAVLTVGFAVMALLWSRAEQNASVARSNVLIAQALTTKEAKARGEAEAQERIASEKAEQLAREDYVNRVNRAYREVQDDNVALAENLLHGCPPERRGWEWHFVERLCNTERLTLDLGNASVNALAFGPDGTWAVSGSGDSIIGGNLNGNSTVDVWEVNSGKLRKTLPGAKGTVYSVAVSPDGKKVASGCTDGLVLVWDVETGQTAWTRSEPGLNAMSMAFSPDGKSLAVGYGFYSQDQVGRVKLWDVASGAELKAFAGPRGGVNAVTFHPDGKQLAVAGSEVVGVWDLETARKIHDLKGHKKWVYCVAYSPDGKWLATGGWDRTVKLREAATGIEVLTIFAHEGFVLGLAFSPDSRNLVTASEDRSIRLWDVPSGQRLAAFHGHTDFVQAVAFRPDGREVCTGSMDGSMRFWDLKASRPVVVEHTGWVDRLAFRRDGLRVLSATLVFGTEAGATKGWNPLTGELDAALAGTTFEKLPIEFVRGNRGWRELTRGEQATVTSPDGKLFAQISSMAGSGTVSRSKGYALSAVVIREIASGRVVQTLTGHSAEVFLLGFSPDGRRLATASADRTIKLWDVQTGQDVFTLRGHTAGLASMAFSPDGNQIVSGGIDATARVWNATPLPLSVIEAHDARYRKKIETLTQLNATTDDAQRAGILASAGQWGIAAEAFAKAVEKEPENLRLRFQLVDALLQAGDRSRVGPACDDILKRFGNSGGFRGTEGIQSTEATGVCRLAQQAITDPEKRQAVHEFLTTPGAWPLILGKLGQWDLVISGFTKHLEATHSDGKPEGLGCFQIQLISLLAKDDLLGYRSAAGKMLSQFSKTTSPNSLNAVAWFCTYAPDAVADLGVPVEMAEKALEGSPPEQKRFALSVLGAALYRAGRLDEAIARLDESVKASGSVGIPQDWAFLAMAHHKNGNGDEARQWIEKLRSHKLDEKAGTSMVLVECQILLREAEALLVCDPTFPVEPFAR